MTHKTLNSLSSWSALTAHYEQIRDERLRDWFAADTGKPSRAERFTIEGGGITADFSKNRITDETLRLLVALADEAGVAKRRDAMFAGEVVNRPKAAQPYTLLCAQRRPTRRFMLRWRRNAPRWPISPNASAAAPGSATPANAFAMS